MARPTKGIVNYASLSEDAREALEAAHSAFLTHLPQHEEKQAAKGAYRRAIESAETEATTETTTKELAAKIAEHYVENMRDILGASFVRSFRIESRSWRMGSAKDRDRER